MAKLIQYATESSYYDGEFGGGKGWIAAGMGYLAVTENGRLIAIDGGFPEDAGDFTKLLIKYSGKDTAEVDLWIITHPHNDHYGALWGIAASDDLNSRVKVNRVLCLFPKKFTEPDDDSPIEKGTAVLSDILTATGAQIITPKTDDVIYLDGTEIEILSLPECIEEYDTPNYLSIIFKLSIGGKRILFTGDATRGRLESAATLGSRLKSDILQMPHHALCDTGDVDFYKAVGAEVLLVPICIAGERSMKSGYYGDATEANEYAEASAKKIYRAYEGTCEIEF